MRFASDNWFGAAPQIMDAVVQANGGIAAAYGDDEGNRRVEARLAEIFEHEVRVFPVITGTAANALSLSLLTPPWGAIFCHASAHVIADECGATELHSGGAKLIGIEGEGSKIDPAGLIRALEGHIAGNAHQVQPAALSITQATELGQVYRPDEIRSLTRIARSRGMRVHMDGARFTNALVSGTATPAELTWKAGVDVLSFGATKNGALGAEAVVLFDTGLAEALRYRRMRGGHLVSKGRFIAAQLEAYLKDDLWLGLARHANAMARRLADGIEGSPVARLAYPVPANEVFAILRRDADARLKAAGSIYHEWIWDKPADMGEDEIMIRLVTAFATEQDEVDRFLNLLG